MRPRSAGFAPPLGLPDLDGNGGFKPALPAKKYDGLKRTRRIEMARQVKLSRDRLERVPAVVFGCLLPGELRIIVRPSVGLADGGAPWNVPVELIPCELRMPNTPLWLELDGRMNILRVWRRNE